MEVIEMDKNWRGLPVHPVDEWDHWKTSRDEYAEMKQLWEELIGHSPIDIEPQVRKLIEFAIHCERLNQADMDAGEGI